MPASPKSKDSIASIGPADSYAAVTKSDSTVVAARSLWIGGTGDVTVKATATSDPVTFSAVPAGTLLPVYAYHVMAATTATLIVAMY